MSEANGRFLPLPDPVDGPDRFTVIRYKLGNAGPAEAKAVEIWLEGGPWVPPTDS